MGRENATIILLKNEYSIKCAKFEWDYDIRHLVYTFYARSGTNLFYALNTIFVLFFKLRNNRLLVEVILTKFITKYCREPAK